VKAGGRVVLLVGAQLKDNLLGAVDGNISSCVDEQNDNAECRSVSGEIWSTNLVHYVKLGETDAFICSFTKGH
jgi:hypothetical protein